MYNGVMETAEIGSEEKRLLRMLTDVVGFARTEFPTMDLLDQAAMIRALKYGKRVCVWSREMPPRATVFRLQPPMIRLQDTLDLHQPAGDYGDLLILDER